MSTDDVSRPKGSIEQPADSADRRAYVSRSLSAQTSSVRSAFEERFQAGEYLGILDSYRVQWDLEKTARDTLQNFFDADKGTLDKTRISLIESQGTEKKLYTVRIEGDANYDFRKLLHMGGTDKADNPNTAGGFGEGSKILSLVLLRDYGFSDVQFGSTGWNIRFYLDAAPAGSYDQPARGLFARLSTENKQPGNFVEITTDSKEKAEEFIRARQLFYSSDNPDFQEPTAASDFDAGGAGFKFLGIDENTRKVRSGNFYDAGQRCHYRDDRWNTVAGVHLWTTHKVFGADRDRGTIKPEKVNQQVIKPMLAHMSTEQLQGILRAMEAAWPTGTTAFYEACFEVMSEAAKLLEKSKNTLQFDEKYLAATPFMSSHITDNLQQQGYVLCHSFFDKIGMKSAKTCFLEMQQHLQVEPTPEQSKRKDILHKTVVLLQQAFTKGTAKKSIENKDIWIYSREQEKSIVSGQYDERFVWLSHAILDGPFAKALATYLHELDHQYCSDQSAAFSYQVTDYLEVTIAALLEDEDCYRQFSQLKKEWDEAMRTSGNKKVI